MEDVGIYRYFMAIWSILRQLRIINDHLVQVVLIFTFSFSVFGNMYRVKSGKPGPPPSTAKNRM
jgi:hypothetical protein